jgi:hypothetical protein
MATILRTTLTIFALITCLTSVANADSTGGGGSSSSSSLGGTAMLYDFLRAAGTNIAARLIDFHATHPPTGQITNLYIAIQPPNWMNGQATYFYLRTAFSTLVQDYHNQFGTKPAITPPNINTFTIPNETLGDIVGAVSQLLTQFRTTTTTTEATISPDNLAVAEAAAIHLKKVLPEINVSFPDLSLNGNFVSDPHSIVQVLLNASKLRSKADTFISENSQDKKSAAKVTAFKTLNASFDNLSTNLFGLSLGSLLQLDYYQTLLTRNGDYFLFITNNYAIAETRVKSNPILDIFTDGPRISYIGGAGIAYFLYAPGSTLVLFDRLDGYRGYRKFKSNGPTYIPNDVRQHLKTFPQPSSPPIQPATITTNTVGTYSDWTHSVWTNWISPDSIRTH